jgi:iron-regulated transporter 1
MSQDETESASYNRVSEEPQLILERINTENARLPVNENAAISATMNIDEQNGYIDPIALYSLASQHLSVTWTQRTAEFVSYLFLIDLFPTTLLPSALYGFFSTLAGVLFGGNAGSFVDISSTSRTRLKVIRMVILVAKLSVASLYTFLLILLLKYPSEAAAAGKSIKSGGYATVWTLFTLVTLSSCVMKLSDIAMSVAIERDWVTTIANGSDIRLTQLNLWLRRIDLGCKLLAPLFAGLLSSTVGNVYTVAILGGIALSGLGFELLWINFVWKRFPVLATNEILQVQTLRSEQPQTEQSVTLLSTLRQRAQTFRTQIITWVRTSFEDWSLFVQSPVFPSSMAISMLYFTTLSFDGSMISWLKTNTYSDTLISGMRGIAVCTGLAGTAVMPFLERKIGLARAGNWSIW